MNANAVTKDHPRRARRGAADADPAGGKSGATNALTTARFIAARRRISLEIETGSSSVCTASQNRSAACEASAQTAGLAPIVPTLGATGVSSGSTPPPIDA